MDAGLYALHGSLLQSLMQKKVFLGHEIRKRYNISILVALFLRSAIAGKNNLNLKFSQI